MNLVSMFDTLGSASMLPDPRAMEEAMKDAQRTQKTKLTGFFSETYKLWLEVDNKRYVKVMEALIDGLTKRTHILMAKDKQFVADGWLVHIEWIEIELTEQLVEPLKATELVTTPIPEATF